MGGGAAHLQAVPLRLHRASLLDCALGLRERHGIRPEEVAEISCRTAAGPVPRLWEPLAAKRRPPNGYAAKFSLPYLVAVMLVTGRAGLAEFTDEAVQDDAVLRLASRVGYEPDPTIDYPRHTWATRWTVRSGWKKAS